MGTPNKTPEQLAQELEAEKQATEAQVDEAGQKAKEEAEQQGLSQDEVNQRVQAARKEEKDKLYPQIEALKESMKEIQETLRAEREEKVKMQEEAEAAKERQRQAKLSDSERQLEAIRRIEEQLNKEREERQKMQLELDQERHKAKLEIYRQRVIQAANGEIIPELVRGNTEAEIDDAVTTAKARYAEIVAQVKNDNGKQVRSNLSRTSANPDTAALEEQDLDELITPVDQDKYLKDPQYREKVQAELERAYEKAAGRR